MKGIRPYFLSCLFNDSVGFTAVSQRKVVNKNKNAPCKNKGRRNSAVPPNFLHEANTPVFCNVNNPFLPNFISAEPLASEIQQVFMLYRAFSLWHGSLEKRSKYRLLSWSQRLRYQIKYIKF